jgi:hypothetical protein
VTTLIQDVQALLDPIALGGAFYAFNPNEPLQKDAAGAVLPFIVWQRVVSADNVTLEGASGLQNTRIQVDIYAPRIEDAALLQRGVDLSFARGPLNAIPLTCQDLFEDAVRLHRIIREFSVWYEETDNVLLYQSTFTAPGSGKVFTGALSVDWTHQLSVTGSGAVDAVGLVEGTNDATGLTGWTTICDLHASGTGSASDSPIPAVGEHAWLRLRQRLTSLTGTAAVATIATTGF